MSKRYKNKLITFYLLLVLILDFFTGSVIEIFPLCEYYSNSKLIGLGFILPIVVLPITGFIVALVVGVKKSNRFFYYLIVPFVSFFITVGIPSIKKKHIVKTSICVIRKAEIVNTFSGKNTQTVDVKFQDEKNKYVRKELRFIERVLARDLTVGDTLLIMYVEDCMEMMYVCRAKPTREELNKCKDDGYYLDEIIYSKEEFKTILTSDRRSIK